MKRRFYDLLHRIAEGADPEIAYHADATMAASHPWNEITGLGGIRDFWAALRTSFPDLERRDLIFIAGRSKPDPRVSPSIEGQETVASLGHLQATFAADFMGIPATNGAVMVRLCEVHLIAGDRIARTYCMIDLLDLMYQAGVWPMVPPAGAHGIWPGPAGNTGVTLDVTDTGAGDRAFQTVMDMHAALLSFDGKSLDSMDHGRFWTDNFMYYAGAGIGAARGLAGFRAHHQIPFLKAFPDREGAGHYVRIGDGNFALTAGWPSVRATHTGPFLGMTPTGRRIDMRVMDFYHVQGGRIAENWLPIDIPHIADQMGYDVFGRLAHIRGLPKTVL